MADQEVLPKILNITAFNKAAIKVARSDLLDAFARMERLVACQLASRNLTSSSGSSLGHRLKALGLGERYKALVDLRNGIVHSELRFTHARPPCAALYLLTSTEDGAANAYVLTTLDHEHWITRVALACCELES